MCKKDDCALKFSIDSSFKDFMLYFNDPKKEMEDIFYDGFIEYINSKNIKNIEIKHYKEYLENKI